MINVVEIFTKGCPTCDYIYRVQRRVNIYDDIKHIELGTKECTTFLEENNIEIKQTPTFYVFINNKLYKKYENIERKDVEEIKKLFL